MKVYETTSSGSFASGLVLFHPATRGPKTVSLANPGSDALLINPTIRFQKNVSANSKEITCVSYF